MNTTNSSASQTAGHVTGQVANDATSSAAHKAANGRADALGDHIELKIPASSEWVRVARLTVAGVASRLPFGVTDVEDIKLAVTEAVNNAILHAPLTSDDATCVAIVFETTPDGLWVSVRDEGRLPEGLPDKSAARPTPDQMPDGGLGLMLIRTLMDEVEQQAGAADDTVVRMFKRAVKTAPTAVPTAASADATTDSAAHGNADQAVVETTTATTTGTPPEATAQAAKGW